GRQLAHAAGVSATRSRPLSNAYDNSNRFRDRVRSRCHHAVADALKLQVHDFVVYAQTADLEPLDLAWQLRPVDHDLAPKGIDVEAKCRLQHHEGRAGRPRLWQASHGIANRWLPRRACEAAEELRQAHPEMMCSGEGFV